MRENNLREGERGERNEAIDYVFRVRLARNGNSEAGQGLKHTISKTPAEA